jgi:hypothetical protein
MYHHNNAIINDICLVLCSAQTTSFFGMVGLNAAFGHGRKM